MDRKKRAKVWPAAAESSRKDELFGDANFEDLDAEFDVPTDNVDGWGINDDAVFSGAGFDAAEVPPRSPRKVGGGSVRPQAAAGKGATKSGDTGGNERAREKTPEDSDADDNDDEDVAFGQDDLRDVREREEEERATEIQRMAKLTTQVKMLMEKVYELRDQAIKAKQEMAVHQEENKELKSKLEQMREEHSDLLMAHARSGMVVGINRAADREGKNARNLDAEMRKRRLAKNALLAGVQTEEEEDLVITLEGISTGILAQLTGRFYRWLGKKLPLGADVRAVQARYGSAVASYFHFYRWLVGSYIVLASPSLVWIVFHVLSQDSEAIIQSEFVGIIPSFLAYSSFDSSNQNMYTVMVVLTTTTQVITATVKWIREDKIRKELFIVDEEQKHVQFAKTFLVGWDNSLTNAQEVEDLRLSNGLAAANMLAEINHADASATRSLDDRIRLYAQRCFGFVLYVGLQVAAWFAIVILTAQADNLASGLTEELQSVTWLAKAAATISTSIVPATVTIINAVMPIIIKAITKLEKWDMERTVTVMLTSRMFLAKILNAFIQALSYLLLANPYLLANNQYSDMRERVEQTFEPTGFSCRMDQAGAGLFQLVVTEFVFSKIITYATLRAAEIRANWAKKPFVKPEFEVAKRMVGLLYFQALILAAYPFFPMGTVFTAPFLILSFKFEKNLLIKFQSKPKGRLKAHDGYSFFIKFYLATVVLLGVMATLFIVGSTNFAKECSLQDNGVGLCGTSSLDADSKCSPLDEDNAYYPYFLAECVDEGYPACVCKGDLACGPFVEVDSAYSSLNEKLRSVSVFGYLYRYLADYNLVVWCAVIVLWLALLFHRNSAQTQADAAADREREWLNEAQTTQARLRKQAKLIEKMQLQAGAMLLDETTAD